MSTQHCIICRVNLTSSVVRARCGCLFDETCFRKLCQLRCPACHGTEDDCRTLCSDWHMSQARKVCAKVCGAEEHSCLLCGKTSFECTLESPCGGRFHEGCYECWSVTCPGCGYVAEDLFSWNLRKASSSGIGEYKLLCVMDKLELK